MQTLGFALEVTFHGRLLHERFIHFSEIETSRVRLHQTVPVRRDLEPVKFCATFPVGRSQFYGPHYFHMPLRRMRRRICISFCETFSVHSTLIITWNHSL